MFRRAKASDTDQADRLVDGHVLAPRLGFVHADRIFHAELAGGHIDVFLRGTVAENPAGFELGCLHDAHGGNSLIEHIVPPKHIGGERGDAAGQHREEHEGRALLRERNGNIHAEKTGYQRRNREDDRHGREELHHAVLVIRYNGRKRVGKT